jgi:3-oxoacyl-[acyl-carrier protein] reductase
VGKLDGQVAIVTGASSGMGRAIASTFAAEGAHVALFDIHPSAQGPDQGATSTHAVDVTDPAVVEGAVTDVVARFGRIDILVAAAGILDETPFLELTPERWDTVVDVDLKGVFLCGRAVAPHMVAAGRGRIINLSSQLGIKGGTGLAHYIAAKAGVIGLTKAMATELAPHGVLVNAIAPGPITTPMVDGLTEEWKAAKAAELPLGRFGTPEEIAPTALLLASSPDGDIYVGQTLGPNSGDVMP